MSQSLDRAIDILERLVVGPQRLGELSELLNVHRSTALRLLQTMEVRGYARRMSSGEWGIGFGLITTGQRALDAIDIRAVAREHLVSLRDELGHTIHLAALVGSDVIYVDKVEGIGAVRMQSRVGMRALAHTAGIAKAMLAFAPPLVQSAAVASCSFERYSHTTITSPAALSAEFDRIVTRGWAVDDGEFEEYINCVAFPIFDNLGAVVAGLSVTALKAIAPIEVLEMHISRIQKTRDAISAELGWEMAGA
jgi:DNA-binding IclR family transcriptional regulator